MIPDIMSASPLLRAQRKYAQRGLRSSAAVRDVTWTPGDGDTYHLVVWHPTTGVGPAFVAVGRARTPLIGTFLALEPWPTFGGYVDQVAASQDMDVQLLWAGWRGLCVLHGHPDAVPPAWLPAWRADWMQAFTEPARDQTL